MMFLAEWTGLEPATPGVTGWGIKRASMRVCGSFAIPKTADFAQFLPGMRQSYSKVFTALTGAPAQTLRRRPTSTGVSSRGRDAGRTFSPISLAAWFQTAEEVSPLRKAEQARELELPTHRRPSMTALARLKAVVANLPTPALSSAAGQFSCGKVPLL